MSADDFTSLDILEELQSRLAAELLPLIKESEPDLDVLPAVQRSRELDKADFTTLWAPTCARRKVSPGEFTVKLAAAVQAKLDASPSPTRLLSSVAGVGPYLNLKLNRPLVYRLTMRAVARLGERFGHTEAAKGKKAIVEHTSSNPNAPLHIGNLRNVMIGAHLARLLAAVGYEVTQAFYVNDLGAQIGLTALAYEKCYPLLKPSMKIDHWIGCMYAIMNTCQELQRAGIDPGKLETACGEGDAAVHVLQDAAVIAAGEDEKKRGSVVEYIDIYRDLRSRYLPMMEVMIPVVRQIPDINSGPWQFIEDGIACHCRPRLRSPPAVCSPFAPQSSFQ